MISVGRERPWRRAGPCPAGSSSARRERARRRGPSRGRPGCGSFWPRGQTLVRAGDADRHDRGAGAQGEHGDPVPGLLERAVGLRVPSGKTNRTWPSSRIRLASRKASTSAPSTVDRVDAAVAARASRRPASRTAPACPASGSAGRAPGMSHDADDRHVEVRGVVGGDDERALARDARRRRPRSRTRVDAAGEDPARVTGGMARDQRA